MASEWQKWYQHEIDAWQGSATIQTLSDAAYRAYHNLIMVQFQQPNGKLIDDEAQLAKLSRMGARWTMPREGMPTIAEEVRACLTVAEDGTIYSPKQLKKWEAAHEKHIAYEARLEAARAAKAARHTPVHSSTDSDMDSSINRAVDSLIDNSIPRAERERQREREVKTKDISAEASSAPAFAALPLVSGDEFPITLEQYNAWVKAFPAVDVEHHIERMRVWLDANPTKRVTHKGALRFAVRWLSKEQDSGAQRGGSYGGNGSVNRNQQRTNSNIEAARRAAQSFGAEIVAFPGGSAASHGERRDLQAVLQPVE